VPAEADTRVQYWNTVPVEADTILKPAEADIILDQVPAEANIILARQTVGTTQAVSDDASHHGGFHDGGKRGVFLCSGAFRTEWLWPLNLLGIEVALAPWGIGDAGTSAVQILTV
jgi:hypothetical protein